MSVRLSTPVSGLPGIGEKAEADLALIGIKTVRDLLWYVPFRYDNFAHRSQIGRAPLNTPLTIDATIKSIKMRPSKSRRVKIIDAVVEDETGELKVMWFNQPYLVKTLPVGSRHSFAGIIDYRFGKTLLNPVHEPYGKNIHTGRIVPVYSLTGSLTLRKLRDAIHASLRAVSELPEWLPKEILEGDSLMSIADALTNVHFPSSKELLDQAMNRLKFDELFLHHVLFQEVRKDRKTKHADPIVCDAETLKMFVQTLPFTLTHAQKMAAWEIIQDLGKKEPMNRLLEGDVGSGKSVVAAMATHAAAVTKHAVAYLAPTEILAAQQFAAFKKFLPTHSVALFTRSQQAIDGRVCKRAELLDALAGQRIDVVIGTHAILQEGVDVSHVSLVIIDEQHRFGVKQRHALLEHDPLRAPHLLSMTATPIPRSLALTIYGDLDVSILNERPKGRKPIGTAVVKEEHREEMWKHVKSQIQEGRQVFVICPLIDPSDALGAKSVSDVEKMLKKGVLADARIGVLHGKMKSDEKQKRQEEFRDKKLDLLVSTTVVEVGVDVPNATVMVIMSAERFGLAQLHQLRGRVGRSDVQSYCYLLPDELNPHAQQRLQAVVDSQDGFELAEKDLQLRGAGNIFGNAQSGFPDFTFATPADVPLMKRAREWSQRLLSSETCFDEYPLIKQKMDEALEQIHLE